MLIELKLHLFRQAAYPQVVDIVGESCFFQGEISCDLFLLTINLALVIGCDFNLFGNRRIQRGQFANTK